LGQLASPVSPPLLGNRVLKRQSSCRQGGLGRPGGQQAKVCKKTPHNVFCCPPLLSSVCRRVSRPVGFVCVIFGRPCLCLVERCAAARRQRLDDGGARALLHIAAAAASAHTKRRKQRRCASNARAGRCRGVAVRSYAARTDWFVMHDTCCPWQLGSRVVLFGFFCKHTHHQYLTQAPRRPRRGAGHQKLPRACAGG
jgi:hypothetical protein